MLSLRKYCQKRFTFGIYSRLYRASPEGITPLNESRHWACYTSIASRNTRGFFVIVTLNIIVNIF